MTRHQLYKSVEDSATWKKLHKLIHTDCYRCPWHRGENTKHVPKHQSWKKSRKSQFK